MEAWEIAPTDIVWEFTRGWWRDDVKAFLTYDPITMNASIRITGLRGLFDRKVAISGRLTSGSQMLS
jgi:hypothetical protein